MNLNKIKGKYQQHIFVDTKPELKTLIELCDPVSYTKWLYVTYVSDGGRVGDKDGYWAKGWMLEPEQHSQYLQQLRDDKINSILDKV